MLKCGQKRCQICPLVVEGRKFTSNCTNDSYFINGNFNCSSCNVVYLVTCGVCHEHTQYVGTTSNFRLRINIHKSRIRTHAAKTDDDPIYKHFNLPAVILFQILMSKSLMLVVPMTQLVGKDFGPLPMLRLTLV